MGRSRYKMERVLGSIKRWFGGLEARYVGMAKTHGQHVLEAIAYNLYRLPGIIMSMA
jgi:transposase, IS5 family